MRKTLLQETKIGEFLSMGVELEGEDIGIYIASADISASCVFKFDEWEKFIEGVKRAHEEFKKVKES